MAEPDTYLWKRETVSYKRKLIPGFILDNYQHLWQKRKWNSSFAFGLEACQYITQRTKHNDGMIYIPEASMRAERKIICKVGQVWGLVNVLDSTMQDGVIVQFEPFDRKDFDGYFKGKKIA